MCMEAFFIHVKRFQFSALMIDLRACFVICLCIFLYSMYMYLFHHVLFQKWQNIPVKSENSMLLSRDKRFHRFQLKHCQKQEVFQTTGTISKMKI